jgi:thiamine phosphate phosphatase / amino-HMP aminohydrolase
MNLILDFDGTVTVDDTIHTLAEYAIRFQKQRGHDYTNAWDTIVKAYAADHARYKESYQPCEGDRTTLSQELDFLRGIRDIDIKSIRRVVESGLFAGIGRNAFQAEGIKALEDGRVKLREGLREFMAEAVEMGWRIRVVSVNWSKSFIEGVLSTYPTTVIANEVEDDGNIMGPDILSQDPLKPAISCCSDKLHALQAITKDHEETTGKVMYIGDTTTDIECILAGHGVAISGAGDSSLLRTLRRVSYSVPHIQDDAACTLFWARDFAEIQQSGILRRITADETLSQQK